MAYQKFTPFNSVAVIAVVGAVVCAFNPGGMGFGYLAALLLLGFAFAIFIVDALIQAFVEGSLKPVLWIEFVIFLSFVLYFYFRKLT